MKKKCKWVKRAKIFLDKHNFEYEEINLDDDEKRKEFYKKVCDVENLKEESKINSVPQIYINDKRIINITDNIESEVELIVKAKTQEQLNQFSNIYLNKIKKNIVINAL